MSALGTLALLLHAVSMPPVLELPEPGLDDTAAYQGYRTRIFRDAAGDAVQIILDRRDGRVVVMWANAADESAAFTVRDTTGAAAALDWGSSVAEVAPAATARSGAPRSMTYRLWLPGERVDLGHFALGSMRWERDLQYQGRHRAPWDSMLPPVPELAELVQRLDRLHPSARDRALRLLAAPSLAALRARLRPSIAMGRVDSVWTVRIQQSSFDGRSHIAIELSSPVRACVAQVRAGRLSIRPRRPGPCPLDLTVRTDAASLTPIGRDRIFNADFLRFFEHVRSDTSARERFRRLERQVRGMELVSYEEKLMAGLPNFATYFGRDMMMTALMMEPLWRPEMLEHVVASVLRKLSPLGEASHEEALGGQAIRENAAEVNTCLAGAETAAAGARDSLLARAAALLGDLARVRENYRMVDESLQLPVVAARYLAHPGIPAAAKRAFLLAPSGQPRSPAGKRPTRLAALLRNFDHVLSQATPYAESPAPTNLVPCVRDTPRGWISGSWRDSRVGYAGGRFAMDVNVLWMPEALATIEASITALARLGIPPDTLRMVADRAGDATLALCLREPGALVRARARWDKADQWFEVRLPAADVRARIAAWLEWLGEPERRVWRAAADTIALPDTLRFLALSLDEEGRAIPVMNTDPAGLVLLTHPDPERAASLIEPLLMPFPVGLLVPGLGPVVANDAYATRDVWEAFAADRYHSPHVVWGREVNLLVLALADQIRTAGDAAIPRTIALRRSLDRVRDAVAASGLDYAELWSYRVEDGALRPARFGSSTDVQLWSLTDLAVQYVLEGDGGLQ